MSATSLKVNETGITLRLAAAYVNIAEQQLRKAAIEGRIPGAGKADGKWVFTREGLDQFVSEKAAKRATRASNANGKAYVIRVKAADFEAVTAALTAFNIKLEPRYAKAKKTTTE
jgi:hypothetical protein